jgi:ABC-type phosphate transport system permease subunit
MHKIDFFEQTYKELFQFKMGFDHWIPLAVNLGVSIGVVFVFGIVNLAITLYNPACGTGGTPLLATWEMITGIIQIVFGFFGLLIVIAISLDEHSNQPNTRQNVIICVGYVAVTHLMNIVLAIVGGCKSGAIFQ